VAVIGPLTWLALLCHRSGAVPPATARQYHATSHYWRAAACCGALSLSLQRTLPGLHTNMESSSISVFSGMHCTTFLSFFLLALTHATQHTQAVFSSFKILKILQDSPSHQIFRRMHRALNIGKK
jgi:hypothetical protein